MAAALMIAIALTAAPGGLGPAAPSSASRGLVVVLSPEVEDEVTRNAMARITGELSAAPFQVVTERVDPTVDLLRAVETAGRGLSPVAAFAIVREAGEQPGSVAVWVSNRITQTTTVQRVRVREGNVDGAAAHLAIEAVELVRASMAGLWPRLPTTIVPASELSQPAPRAETGRLRIGVGVALFRDFAKAPSVWAPVVAVCYGKPGRTAVRLEVTGLGPGSDTGTSDGSAPSDGSARLQRAAVDLGLVRLFRPGRVIQPLVSAAVGLQALSAQGTGVSPSLEHDQTAWSAMLAVGAGLAVALGPHVALTAEAKALFLWPTVVVRVADTDVARFDRPSLFASGGLLATF